AIFHIIVCWHSDLSVRCLGYSGHHRARCSVDFEVGSEARVELFHRSGCIHPPFGAPDAPDPPAKVGQHHLAQSVAIARRCRPMVRGAIAFYTSKITSREVRMHYTKVNTKERDADLGMNYPTPLLECSHYGILEG